MQGMRTLRTTFRIVIALVGLTAVVFGALEHEDLIFQSDRAVVDPLTGTPAGPDASANDWQTAPAHSGTESQFRQEIGPHLAVAERTVFVWSPAHGSTPRRLLPVARLSSRAPPAGIVALRL